MGHAHGAWKYHIIIGGVLKLGTNRVKHTKKVGWKMNVWATLTPSMVAVRCEF